MGALRRLGHILALIYRGDPRSRTRPRWQATTTVRQGFMMTAFWAVTGVIGVGLMAQSHHRWAPLPVAAVCLAGVAMNLASAIALWRRQRSGHGADNQARPQGD